jgi:hypothetical protein
MAEQSVQGCIHSVFWKGLQLLAKLHDLISSLVSKANN